MAGEKGSEDQARGGRITHLVSYWLLDFEPCSTTVPGGLSTSERYFCQCTQLSPLCLSTEPTMPCNTSNEPLVYQSPHDWLPVDSSSVFPNAASLTAPPTALSIIAGLLTDPTLRCEIDAHPSRNIRRRSRQRIPVFLDASTGCSADD